MVNRFTNIFLTLLTVFLFSSISMVIVYRFVPVHYTPLMLLRQIEAHREGRNLHIVRKWTPLDEISESAITVIINNEDARFYNHHGFDFIEIEKAYQTNQKAGKIQRGGSTISQQTAKNLFCLPHRTYFRKAVEAYFTVLIELFWSKDKILEVYLNIIEMGDGVFGIESASETYFHRTAQHLNPEQAQLLARIIPAPRQRAWALLKTKGETEIVSIKNHKKSHETNESFSY
ncbi:MAG: monofunctional biosynthetic peptidoglycan transglycosylase [Paludibacteraceae bacterium]|nr:monofunctional biosynthetic peptidoglycan transglycosylase [Paludibacteraceae bacterium]